eukprot:COSAG01_NODE_15869_length_1290_cov_83.137699_2_plen_171_part_00
MLHPGYVEVHYETPERGKLTRKILHRSKCRRYTTQRAPAAASAACTKEQHQRQVEESQRLQDMRERAKRKVASDHQDFVDFVAARRYTTQRAPAAASAACITRSAPKADTKQVAQLTKERDERQQKAQQKQLTQARRLRDGAATAPAPATKKAGTYSHRQPRAPTGVAWL